MRATKLRVPVRYQMTKTECAAACLSMVLSYFGRHTTVPQSRAMLGAGRDGTSAAALVEAANQSGLEVDVDSNPDPFSQPFTGVAVAYLSAHHFVVVTSIGARHVRLVDPSLGRQRLTRAEFADRFGGVLLKMRPGPAFGRERMRLRDEPMLRYVRQFVAAPRGRRLLGLTVLMAAGIQFVGLGVPLLTKFVVDTLVPQGQVELLPLVGIAVLVMAGLTATLSTLRSVALLAIRGRADRALTRNLVAHLFQLPMSFFLDRARGDLLMRLASVSTTREAMTQQLLMMALDSFLLVGYLIGLALLAPAYLPLLALLFMMQMLLLGTTYQRLRGLTQRELTVKSEEQGYLVETLEAIVPLKANGVETRALGHWEQLFDRYQRVMLQRGRATAWLGGLQRGVSTLGPLLLLWAGAGMVLSGDLTLGGMLAANVVAMSVLAPMETLASSGQLYHSVRAQIERLFDVMDTPVEATGSVRLPAHRPTRIEVADLTFRYQQSQAPVLADISFSLSPGAKLGIVGRTGSGKSTLALLLLGLLHPDTGHIRHDGVDLSALDLRDLRSQCGAVLQELTLFNGSIRDNLTLSRPGADDREVVHASRLAGLHDDVLALPMGYDTLVGEGGAALSAGQRQRVALGRALIHRPRLLILDEATSHLDPQTERQVDEVLSGLDVTRVVISHRLSAVRNANLILVLEHGRLVQQGQHLDLIGRPGVYHQLFASANSESTSDQQGRTPVLASRFIKPGAELADPVVRKGVTS